MAKRTRRRDKGTYGHWQAQGRYFYRITRNGQRHTVADKDPDRAKAKLQALLATLDAGVTPQDGRQTLDTFSEHYFADVLPGQAAESTVADYQKRYDYYIRPNLGGERLDAITHRLILNWRNAMHEAYALSSVRQAVRLLDRMLDQAVAEKLITSNPATGVRPPRLKKDADVDDDDDVGTALTAEQVTKLLEAARTKPARASRYTDLSLLYTLAVRLGLRRGEALGLRWEDITWEGERRGLTVTRQVVVIDGKLKVTPPKTAAAKRWIPLADDLVTALKAEMVKSGHRKGYLFRTEAGGPWHPRNLLRHFGKVLERAELPHVRFHDLRVTFVTLLRARGVDLEVIAAIAGHSTAQVTADVYSKATDDRKREALRL